MSVCTTSWSNGLDVHTNPCQPQTRSQEPGRVMSPGPAQQLHQAHKKVASTLATVTAFFILVDPGAIWLFMDPLLSTSPVLIHVYTCTL